MNKEYILKKRIFGGFDRRQVIECLAKLQNDYSEHDKHDEILKLEEKINNLSSSISEKDIELENLRKKLDELDTLYSSNNTSDTFNTLTQADKIIDTAKKEAEQYIKSADSYIKSSNKEFEVLMDKLTRLNNEITEIGSGATRISENLSKVSVEDAKQTENIKEETIDSPITSDEITCDPITESDEEDIPYEDENAEIFLTAIYSDDEEATSYNSIDNFFAELEKLIDDK